VLKAGKKADSWHVDDVLAPVGKSGLTQIGEGEMMNGKSHGGPAASEAAKAKILADQVFKPIATATSSAAVLAIPAIKPKSSELSQCSEPQRQARAPGTLTLSSMKAAERASEKAPGEPGAINPVATPTLEQRRRLVSSLTQYYVDEVTGYADGCSDETVAAETKLPIEWVRKIRDENFGPIIKPKMVTELEQVLKRIERDMRSAAEMVSKAEQAEAATRDKIDSLLAEAARMDSHVKADTKLLQGVFQRLEAELKDVKLKIARVTDQYNY
jgi:hypothetical protein